MTHDWIDIGKNPNEWFCCTSCGYLRHDAFPKRFRFQVKGIPPVRGQPPIKIPESHIEGYCPVDSIFDIPHETGYNSCEEVKMRLAIGIYD
jgi:hypothetical protein